MAEEETPPSGIRTLHVAARMLIAMADYNEPVRVTDLARRLKIATPTISRHLATWRTLGFVDKPEGQDRYRLSMRVARLANAALRQNDYASIAQPHVLELRDIVSETIVFCARSRDGIIVLLCVDSGRSTTVVVREGSSVDLPFSPSARVIEAFKEQSQEEIDALAATFDYSVDPRWSETAFKRKLRRALEEWYDFEMDLAGSFIGAIAAPVFNHNNDVIGAVAVIRPSGSILPEPSEEMIREVMRAARRITVDLGSRKWDDCPHVDQLD